MKKLKISESLSLPIDFVTMACAILAQRGAGKSYTASVIAEEMLENKQQIIVLDPTGAWWGLRSSADGNHPGYPVAVFGGDNADLPLESTSGAVLAEAIVDQGFSAILDLDLFSNSERNRFAADFLEVLYRKNREAIHVFVDEADVFAPQRPMPDQMRLLGAMEALVRRGRKKGIGCTMITQRPAVLNKNVLTQADVLVALRLSHPKDIDPIEEWASAKAVKETLKSMTETLPGMATGTGWFWSPQALGIFEQVKIRERRTFDSGATPKVGQKIRPPKVMAKPDLLALGEQIAATVQKQADNDPKLLRVKITDLQAQVRKLEARQPEEITKVIEKVFDRTPPALLSDLRAIALQFPKLVETAEKYAGGVLDSTNEVPRGKPLPKPSLDIAQLVKDAPSVFAKVVMQGGRELIRANEELDRDLKTLGVPPGEKKMISAAIDAGPIGATRTEISVLSGYRKTSRDTYIKRAAAKGFLRVEGDRVHATPEGIAALGDFHKPLPKGRELQAHWLNKLPIGEAKILEIAIREYPRSVTRGQITDETGYQKTSRDTYIKRLAPKRLIEKIGSDIKASDTLF